MLLCFPRQLWEAVILSQAAGGILELDSVSRHQPSLNTAAESDFCYPQPLYPFSWWLLTLDKHYKKKKRSDCNTSKNVLWTFLFRFFYLVRASLKKLDLALEILFSKSYECTASSEIWGCYLCLCKREYEHLWFMSGMFLQTVLLVHCNSYCLLLQ